MYLDDVIIFSRSFGEHMEHLKVVLERIAEHWLKMKVGRFSFAQESVALLGHVVDGSGAHVDSRKVKAITDFPRPSNATEVRSFLGIRGITVGLLKGLRPSQRPSMQGRQSKKKIILD